jgi:hypothetical protein
MSRCASGRRPTTLTDRTQVHKNLPLVPDLSDGDNPRWERGRGRRRTWGMAGTDPNDDGARRRAMRRAVEANGLNSEGVCLHRDTAVDDEEGTELGEPLNSGWSGERTRTRPGYTACEPSSMDPRDDPAADPAATAIIQARPRGGQPGSTMGEKTP